MVRLRFNGAASSSYWLFDDRDVGAVVFNAEFVRSLERVEPAGVAALGKGVFVCEPVCEPPKYWTW